MADIKKVYQVAVEMGNSPAVVKSITFKQSQKPKQEGFGLFDQIGYPKDVGGQRLLLSC